MPKSIAASMVSEVARICGRVEFELGVTSYLGRAWFFFLKLHGVLVLHVQPVLCACYCLEG